MCIRDRIILTIIVKLVLYPFYAKQIKSMMKLTTLQPKMNEIQQKYGRDKALMNQKMAEFYKEEGVSMYGGCLPMLIQMIVVMEMCIRDRFLNLPEKK